MKKLAFLTLLSVFLALPVWAAGETFDCEFKKGELNELGTKTYTLRWSKESVREANKMFINTDGTHMVWVCLFERIEYLMERVNELEGQLKVH